jgi:hypothetical protein
MGFTVRNLLNRDRVTIRLCRIINDRFTAPIAITAVFWLSIVVMGIVLADPIVAILTNKLPCLRCVDLHAE